MAEKLTPESARKAPGIDTEKFGWHVRQIDSAKQRTDDGRSELGSAWKNAEDMLGINRPALKLALKVRDMEADKREAFLRDLQSYLFLLKVERHDDLFEGAAPMASPSEPSAPSSDAGVITEAQAARKAGIAAGREGKNADANPHGPEGPLSDAWYEGWLGGQRQLAAEMGKAERKKGRRSEESEAAAAAVH